MMSGVSSAVSLQSKQWASQEIFAVNALKMKIDGSFDRYGAA
jgi:hypothetical protein